MATKQALKYKDEGNVHFKAGEHAKAIEKYTYATELDPNNPVFYTNRSNAYYIMKNYEKSERDARKSIKCKATWEKGHYRLGMALQAQEKFKEAKDAFAESVRLKPDNGTFKSALAGAKAAMMKGMSQAEIIKEEGNIAFKGGKIDEAEKVYTRAINACKSDAKDTAIKLACLANRAACYRQLYNPDGCIDDCTEVLKIDPRHQKALIRRAQAYESMERYQEAIDDYFQCFMINSKATVASQGLNRLRSLGFRAKK